MGSSLELTISLREMKILFLVVCLSFLASQHISEASEDKDLLAQSTFGEVDLLPKLTEAKQKIKRSAENKKKKRNKKQRKSKKLKKSRRNKQRKNKQSGRKTGRNIKKKTRGKKAGKGKKRKGRNKNKQRQKKKQGKKRNKGRKKKTKRKLTKTQKNNDAKSVLPKTRQARKVFKGQHCDYIDLCGLKTKSANGCDSGMKFVVKGQRYKDQGKDIKIRRQFL